MTKSALKLWHRPIELADHPLTQLASLQTRPHADALRDHMRRAIHATAPSDETPDRDDDPRWLDPTWRTWTLLTLLYLRHQPRGTVQARIGMAEGGQYYRELRRAIDELALILQRWEADSRQPNVAQSWPGGAVRLNDPLYIARQSDAELSRLLNGQTVTLRGARQVGKTSLLVRGVEAAVAQSNSRVVYIDLQAIPQSDFTHYDDFLHLLAAWIVDELALESELVERAWRSRLGAARKLTKLIERVVLPSAETSLILALDEVDRLVATPFGNDFFGLLRSWHNLRSRNPQWERLTILMAISTEPYLLIQDLQQSPFNVGRTLYLEDFTLAQVRDLNERHGAPLTEAETQQLYHWVGGHPFLTRLTLYSVVTQSQSLETLMATANEATSPFAEHLGHLWRISHSDDEIRQGLQAVLLNKTLAETALLRLQKAGLIRQSGAKYQVRCPLYRDYFVGRL